MSNRSRPLAKIAGTIRLAAVAFIVTYLMPGCGSWRPSKSAVILIDPKAADSFRSLCDDHPLPPDIAYRSVDAPDGKRKADISLSFVERAEGPREKAVSAYYPYPVKYLWEDDAVPHRDVPLSDIELPLCLRTNGLSLAESGELVLRLGKGAPGALKEWFAHIPESGRSPLSWVAAVGDIMLDRGIQDLILSDGGVEKVFGDLLPLLLKADFFIGNLEGAATERGTRADKLYTFRFPPATAAKLKDAGFDYLSLSNNHSFDFGQRGFLDGMSALRGAGIGFSGAGIGIEEASDPFLASALSQRLSVVAFGAFNPEQPARAIRASASNPGILLEAEGLQAIGASSGPDTVDIAVVHAGKEYADAPDAAARKLYRGCVDSGADIVLGSHPHVIQGVEAYRGRLIVYSLGNFVFRGMEGKEKAMDTIILFIGLMEGRVLAMEPVFARIGPDGPRLEPSASGERFRALCRSLAPSAEQ